MKNVIQVTLSEIKINHTQFEISRTKPMQATVTTSGEYFTDYHHEDALEVALRMLNVACETYGPAVVDSLVRILKSVASQ